MACPPRPPMFMYMQLKRASFLTSVPKGELFSNCTVFLQLVVFQQWVKGVLFMPDDNMNFFQKKKKKKDFHEVLS